MSQHEEPEPDARARSGSRRRHTAPSHAVAFSQTVDGRIGRIWARGVLDRETAERICGTVAALDEAGHERISLDLRQVDATEGTELRRLTDLQNDLRSRGRHLAVVHALPPGAP